MFDIYFRKQDKTEEEIQSLFALYPSFFEFKTFCSDLKL